MKIAGAIAQLQTADLAASIREGEHFHLYLETNDAAAAAKALKRNGVRLVTDLHDTAWGTRELVFNDDQGHTLYLGEIL